MANPDLKLSYSEALSDSIRRDLERGVQPSDFLDMADSYGYGNRKIHEEYRRLRDSRFEGDDADIIASLYEDQLLAPEINGYALTIKLAKQFNVWLGQLNGDVLLEPMHRSRTLTRVLNADPKYPYEIPQDHPHLRWSEALRKVNEVHGGSFAAQISSSLALACKRFDSVGAIRGSSFLQVKSPSLVGPTRAGALIVVFGNVPQK